MTLSSRLTGIGFVVGGAVHTAALSMLPLGIAIYGANYPWWRHVTMAGVDMAMAWIALRRPSWLLIAILAFEVEQLIVNGFGVMQGAIMIAAMLAAWERWRATAPQVGSTEE